MSTFISGNALGFLLTDVSRLFRQQFERTVGENGLGLTAGEIRALGHVIRYRGSRQAALAERMGVEPMTLSAYLDRLEARGLIRRSADPTDRRAKLIEPTEAGEATIDELDPLFGMVLDFMTRGLPAADIEILRRSLQAMRANLTSDPEILSDRSAPAEPLRDLA